MSENRQHQPQTPSGEGSSFAPFSRPPPSIPDHEMLRLIGRGSYGEVWLARTVLGDYRAVKIVYRDRFEHERPYEREFEGIRKFEPISRLHDSQVDILHVGRNDAAGCFYYVMELADDAAEPRVEGGSEVRVEGLGRGEGASSQLSTPDPLNYIPHTLKLDLHRRSHLPVDECLTIGLALTTAVQHLHEHGLVHRDIKPSNIIFVGGVPKLADIGLVAGMDATMSFVGTSGFLPPEGPGTPQADLYSLGKVLYEISTGRDRQDFPKLPPELLQPPVPLAHRMGEGSGVRASGGDGNALLELNAVILKACAHDPRQRYQSAQEMAADLALLQKGKSVRRVRGHQRLWSQVKKAALGLALLALAVAGVARMFRQTQRNEASGDGPPSTNEMANALVDKAMRLLRADESVGSFEIYTNLMRAVELDPNFARAYAGLFDLLVDRTGPGLPLAPLQEVRGIVAKLEELAPHLASTHEYQSMLAYSDLDFPRAEKHALKAIDADPSAGRIAQYCFYLTRWGRSEEARRRLKFARAFESSRGFIYRVMGHSYYVERDFTNAIAWYRQALQWEPRQASATYYIGDAYLAMGDYTNAFDHLARGQILYGGDPSQTQAEFDQYRRALAEGGPRGYWEERRRQVEMGANSGPYHRAVIQIQLGATNTALDLLYQCYEKGESRGRSVDNRLNYLLFHECWDGLRGDRRFQELLDKIGYTKVMRERKQ